MQLHFYRGRDLVFIDKPRGFSTHATDSGQPGIVDFFEKSLNQKLYIVHRLDKTTSGALVFATTPERAHELAIGFQEKTIQKKYWFITDRPSNQDSFSESSLIDQKEAYTDFKRIKRSPFFELWQATPLTGRTHQIRKHAQKLGLNILGDTTYGGTAFPELCLHAFEISIPGEETWQCPAPRIFERLGLLKNQKLSGWLSQIDRRQRLFNFLKNPHQCLRLIHTDDFRLDLYGQQLWAYWYYDKAPTSEDILAFETVARILGRPWLLKFMQDRGQDPNQKTIWKSEDFGDQWQAQEENIIYQLRENSGQSAGLFLDQGEQRKSVQRVSKNKTVLNLFSYTCGFSVAAALGGAKQVTSVDASSNFLNWGKENFALNGLAPENYEFFTQDVILFLEGAAKRGRQFDLIICDPPSFGRFKKEVFRLEKDLPALLNLCSRCLRPGGELLFSCNFEGWSADELIKRIKKQLPKAKVELNPPRLDYELPQEEALMKSVWIR